MLGVATQAAALTVFDIDEQAAGVGAIQRANGMANVGQVKIIAAGVNGRVP